MAFNINDFKNRGLTLGGARPTLFQVTLATPFGAAAGALEKFTFTCKSTSVPAATISPIDIGYFGRKIHLAGDRNFADWSVVIMNDEDFLVRNMFEQWSNLINSFVGNQTTLTNNTYKSTDALVTQYGKDGTIIKNYSFVGIFPLTVDPMGLSWDSQNSIQEFGVTFSYDYWVPYVNGNIPTGEAGNGSAASATP